MTPFAALLRTIEDAPGIGARTEALARYLGTAPMADRVWALALLAGRSPRRIATNAELRQWAIEAAALPDWLFQDSHAVSGDLAETIALILPPAVPPAPGLAVTLNALAALSGGQPAHARRAFAQAAWSALPPEARLLLNRLMAGTFRAPVTRALTVRALALASGQDQSTLAHRLISDWDPATTVFATLTGDSNGNARPYAFARTTPLTGPPAALGRVEDWRAEWAWPGLRCQIIARPGVFAVWSTDGSLITDRFPEFAPLAALLPPGTVLDGVAQAWDAAHDRPLPPGALQTRITRKTLPKSLLRDAPARFIACDLLEADGRDQRTAPLSSRHTRLAGLLAALPPGLPLALSPWLDSADWSAMTADHATARAKGTAGLILKRAGSAYTTATGDWLAWPPDPLIVDAVLIYAHAAPGRGFGDFTFALRDGDALVPVARTAAGLDAADAAELTRWVQAHVLDRFGPVRQVPPEQVFRIAFDAVSPSPRHKSGLALQQPRITGWLRGALVTGIGTLQDLRRLAGPP